MMELSFLLLMSLHVAVLVVILVVLLNLSSKTENIEQYLKDKESKTDNAKREIKEEEGHRDRSDDDKAAIQKEDNNCARSTQMVDTEGDLNKIYMQSDGDQVGGRTDSRINDHIDEPYGREEFDTPTWPCTTDNAREQKWFEEEYDDLGQNQNADGPLDEKADEVSLEMDGFSSIDYHNNTEREDPRNLDTTTVIYEKVQTEDCETRKRSSFQVEVIDDGSENLSSTISLCQSKTVNIDARYTCDIVSFQVRVQEDQTITTWTCYGLTTSTGYAIAVLVFKIETPEYMTVTSHVVYGPLENRIIFQHAVFLRRQEFEYFGDSLRFDCEGQCMRAMHEPLTRNLTLNYTCDVEATENISATRHVVYGPSENQMPFQHAVILRRQMINNFGDLSILDITERRNRAMYEPPTRCSSTVNYTCAITIRDCLHLASQFSDGRRQDLISFQHTVRQDDNTQLQTSHGFPVQCILSPLIEPAYSYTETERNGFINGVVSNKGKDQPEPNQTSVFPHTVTSKEDLNYEIVNDGGYGDDRGAGDEEDDRGDGDDDVDGVSDGGDEYDRGDDVDGVSDEDDGGVGDDRGDGDDDVDGVNDGGDEDDRGDEDGGGDESEGDERTVQQRDIRQHDVQCVTDGISAGRPFLVKIMQSGNTIQIDLKGTGPDNRISITPSDQLINPDAHVQTRVEKQDDDNDSLVVPNVDDSAEYSVQVGDNNSLISDEGYASIDEQFSSSEFSSIESGEGNDFDADTVNDRYVAKSQDLTNESSKSTHQIQSDDRIIIIFPNNPNEVQGRIHICRKNAGLKNEVVFIQIGRNNSYILKEPGRWLCLEFDYQIVREIYTGFLIRVVPSKQWLNKIEMHISGTYINNSNVDRGMTLNYTCIWQKNTDTNSCTSNVGITNGSSFTDHMNHPIQSLYRLDANSYSDKSGLTNNSRLFGVDSAAKDNGKTNYVFESPVFRDNGAENIIKEQPIQLKKQKQIMCTGETQFDVSRCPNYITEGHGRPFPELDVFRDETSMDVPVSQTNEPRKKLVSINKIAAYTVNEETFSSNERDKTSHLSMSACKQARGYCEKGIIKRHVYTGKMYMHSRFRMGMSRLNSEIFSSNSKEMSTTETNRLPLKIMYSKTDVHRVDCQIHIPSYKRKHAVCNSEYDIGVWHKKRKMDFSHKECQKDPGNLAFTMKHPSIYQHRTAMATDEAASNSTFQQDPDILEESNMHIRSRTIRDKSANGCVIHPTKRKCHVNDFDNGRQVSVARNRQFTDNSHSENKKEKKEIQKKNVANVAMGDTTKGVHDCFLDKTSTIGDGRLLDGTDHKQLVEAKGDNIFATGKKFKLMPEPENSLEDKRTTSNIDQQMIEDSIKRRISSSLRNIPLEKYKNLIEESFGFKFHRLSDDGIECKIQDSNGSERNLLKLRSVFKVFIREELTSLEVFRDIPLPDENDIDVQIVK